MKAIPVTIETQKEYKVSMGEAITTRPANLEELDVTENGTYVAPEDGGYTPVVVNVTPSLQSKTATPTESSQTIAPDTGYDGLSSVSVGAISSTYVGSGITRQDSESIEDLLDPEGMALIPAGYYEENAWFSVPEAYHSAPTVSINSTGLITASHTQAKGYVSTSRAGTETDTLQLSTQAAATINPTESEQTAVASGKYTTGAVKVGAISSTYVGSGISRKSSTDLTSSGATVTAPAGYYASNATKTIASGTAGTPTATKGTVSNHSVSVTPSVTNTTGYITGGTKTGTAVSVSASELVSGSKSINQNGTGIDVTNYATVDVSVPSGGSYQSKTKTYTPSTSQQTDTITPDSGYDALSQVGITVNAMPTGTATAPTSISGTAATVSTGTNTLTLTKTVSVTPRITTAGYISSGTAGNASVSLSANVTTKAAATITPSTSNQTIASGTYLTGTQTISGDANLVAGNIKNGTTIFGVTGTYDGGGGGGGLNIQVYQGMDYARATSYTATDVTLTVKVSGTYKVSWMGFRNTTSGTSGSQLYKNGSAVGSAHTTFTSSYGQYCTETLTFNADDVLVVRARARSTSYYMYVGNLIIEQTS